MSVPAVPAAHDMWCSSEENTLAKLIEIKGYSELQVKELQAETKKRRVGVPEVDKNDARQLRCLLLKDDMERMQRIPPRHDDKSDPSGKARHIEKERQIRIMSHLRQAYNTAKVELHLSWAEVYREKNMEAVEKMANEVHDANIAYETRMVVHLNNGSISEEEKGIDEESIEEDMKGMADSFTEGVFRWDLLLHESSHKYLSKFGGLDSKGSFVPPAKRKLESMVPGNRKQTNSQTLVSTPPEHSNTPPPAGPPSNVLPIRTVITDDSNHSSMYSTKSPPSKTDADNLKVNAAADPKSTIDKPNQTNNGVSRSTSGVVGGSAEKAIDLTSPQSTTRQNVAKSGQSSTLSTKPGVSSYALVRREKSMKSEATFDKKMSSPNIPQVPTAPKSSVNASRPSATPQPGSAIQSSITSNSVRAPRPLPASLSADASRSSAVTQPANTSRYSAASQPDEASRPSATPQSGHGPRSSTPAKASTVVQPGNAPRSSAVSSSADTSRSTKVVVPVNSSRSSTPLQSGNTLRSSKTGKASTVAQTGNAPLSSGVSSCANVFRFSTVAQPLNLSRSSTPLQARSASRSSNMAKASMVAQTSSAPRSSVAPQPANSTRSSTSLPTDNTSRSATTPQSTNSRQSSSSHKRQQSPPPPVPAPKKPKTESTAEYIGNRPYVGIGVGAGSKKKCLEPPSDNTLKQLRRKLKGEKEVDEVIYDNNGWIIIYKNSPDGFKAMWKSEFAKDFHWNGYVEGDLYHCPAPPTSK